MDKEKNDKLPRLSSESLKKVIIRYDFTGIVTIEKWLGEFATDFCSKFFRNYSEGEMGEAQIDLGRFSEVSSEMSIPLKGVRKMAVHVFSGSKFTDGDDIVELQISQVSITLDITCRGYKSIRPYLDFINELMYSLMKSNPFLKIRRIGIRKFDGFEFNDWKSMAENISIDAILQLREEVKNKPLERTLTDRWQSSSLDAKINYTCKFRYGNISNNSIGYRLILDIDAYADEEMLEIADAKNVKDYLDNRTTRLNYALYKLFIESLTPNYISCHEQK